MGTPPSAIYHHNIYTKRPRAAKPKATMTGNRSKSTWSEPTEIGSPYEAADAPNGERFEPLKARRGSLPSAPKAVRESTRISLFRSYSELSEAEMPRMSRPSTFPEPVLTRGCSLTRIYTAAPPAERRSAPHTDLTLAHTTTRRDSHDSVTPKQRRNRVMSWGLAQCRLGSPRSGRSKSDASKPDV